MIVSQSWHKKQLYIFTLLKCYYKIKRLIEEGICSIFVTYGNIALKSEPLHIVFLYILF